TAKVTAALKKLSALVVASGGDYQRIDLKTVDDRFAKLQARVNGASHYVARCDACATDGSSAVFQLLMNDGPRSAPMVARLVGANGFPGSPTQPKHGLLQQIWD